MDRLLFEENKMGLVLAEISQAASLETQHSESANDQIWPCWSRRPSDAITISWAQPDSPGKTAPYKAGPDLQEAPGEIG